MRLLSLVAALAINVVAVAYVDAIVMGGRRPERSALLLLLMRPERSAALLLFYI